MDAGLLKKGMGILFFQLIFNTKKFGILMAYNVQAYKTLRRPFAAMCRRPSDRRERSLYALLSAVNPTPSQQMPKLTWT